MMRIGVIGMMLFLLVGLGGCGMPASAPTGTGRVGPANLSGGGGGGGGNGGGM